ncbi:hypothetical protein J056_004003 [Wallemia ichthyophaga EXF-994]|uniref:ClpA/ClpB AAA lid domain-containing protein n=1 Tax=Wallemia ichthyophaga (strain EXF-994 / CBS 113033) TaxID=1299270 RepID=R9AHV4_WALI9|nr:uncharacterized protein J056_004003 [Wallemia ichthyophaga EXF-994]EOR01767.1 hypothetical protein J056_004003 [Wallemia ichthyophaga EXF-994]
MSDIWHLTSALSEGLEKAKTHYDGMDYFNTSIEGAATYKKSLDNLQLQHDRRKTVAAKAAAAADKRKAKAGSDKPNITYRTLYNKKRNIGLKIRYETHHGVTISDDALLVAAKHKDRYISDHFLPDKAIDPVDEASSTLKLAQESKLESLAKLD